MWVVYCIETGNEYDRFEDLKTANRVIRELDSENEDRALTFGKRWEA